MELINLLQRAIRALKKDKIPFALGGGIVASIYRKEPRFTNDADLVLSVPSKPHETAKMIIESLGMRAGMARLGDITRMPMMNKKSSPIVMVVGRHKDPELAGVDLILPAMPWVPGAMARAIHHVVDFGFDRIPCITVEDLVLSKLYAVKHDTSRFKDLDDLKSVFLSGHDLDLDYLTAEMESLEVLLPREMREFAPKALVVASKRMGSK